MAKESDVYVGVDPGIDGAIAALDRHRNVLMAEFFPLTEVPKTTKGKKREFDFVSVARLVNVLSEMPGKKLVLVEQVTAGGNRKMGAASAFGFGGSYWAIRQALSCAGMSVELISPRLWQKCMLTGTSKDSDALRASYLAKARTMFPSVDLSRKKDAERAAALLIAEYCRRQFVGDQT